MGDQSPPSRPGPADTPPPRAGKQRHSDQAWQQQEDGQAFKKAAQQPERLSEDTHFEAWLILPAAIGLRRRLRSRVREHVAPSAHSSFSINHYPFPKLPRRQYTSAVSWICRIVASSGISCRISFKARVRFFQYTEP